MGATSRTEEHVGEWKLSLEGATLAELFAEAAAAVSRSCTSARATARTGWVELVLAASDDAALLADFVNELLGRSEIDAVAYDEVDVAHVGDGRIRARVRGHPVAEWRSPLKAATYHGLSLAPSNGGWRAALLLDV